MSVPRAKTPAMIPSVISASPAGPELVPSPSASKMRTAMSRPADRPTITRSVAAVSKTATRGGELPWPEDTERAAGRLERRNVTEHDPAQHIGKRRAGQSRRERRRHDRQIGLLAD